MRKESRKRQGETERNNVNLMKGKQRAIEIESEKKKVRTKQRIE
jgi:hypothetical protein